MTTPAYRWFTDGMLLYRMNGNELYYFCLGCKAFEKSAMHPDTCIEYLKKIPESTARELFPEAFK